MRVDLLRKKMRFHWKLLTPPQKTKKQQWA